jgi:hypothetical protein
MIASTVLLMMGAESTRNLAVKNKYDCLKLNHVGYLIKWSAFLSNVQSAFLGLYLVITSACFGIHRV